MNTKNVLVKLGRRNSRWIEVDGQRYRAPKGSKLTVGKRYSVSKVTKGAVFVLVGRHSIRFFKASDLKAPPAQPKPVVRRLNVAPRNTAPIQRKAA